MQILEPLLFNQNQGAFASGMLDQEMEFNLAALEGILILGVAGYYGGDLTEIDDAEVSMALSLNPSDNALNLDALLAGNPDVFWFESYTAIAAGTPGNYVRPRSTTPYRDYSTVGGLLALTNLSAHYHSDSGTQTGTISVAYKRVLLDERELIPFVALRRR